RSLRNPHGRTPFCRRFSRGGVGPARPRGARTPVGKARGPLAGAGRRGSQSSGQESRQPLPDSRRNALRLGPRAQRRTARGTQGAHRRRAHISDVVGRRSPVVAADRSAAAANQLRGATLQNKGFKTRALQKPDSTVPPDHVIDTDPKASETVDANSQVSINVSTGP